jgi:D-xylose transport system substrate-binding protein
VKRSSIFTTVALAATTAVLLTACSSSGSGGGEGRACVILPDAASSPRWENGDRPALEAAFEEAGYESDIQNAQGDTAKYASIADAQISQGCDVMLLVDHQGAAVSVTEKAKAEGIPVIAYDRPIPGADYYVSFNNFDVGRLEGQVVVDGLNAAGIDPASATVVYISGDPADGNAAMFYEGATEVMEGAGITPAAEPPGLWDGEHSATVFEQALTDLGGEVDAVWAANDTNAAGVITILDKNGLTVPVSGQDASVAGLQNIILGKQGGTVYKPYQLIAAAASDVAIKLLEGEEVSYDLELDDGTPFVTVTPTLVTIDNVQQVIDDGNASYDEICAGEVAAACDAAGISPAA